jgi:hypothetical protein
MLCSLMMAIDCVAQALLTAMRIWSLSAAFCADWLCESVVGFAFWEWRLHFITSLYSISMFPACRVFILSLMVCCMDFPSFCVRVVGAKISISRWISSHQNIGVASASLCDEVYAEVSPRRMAACNLMNLALFRCLLRRCRLHVFRKSGGVCV